MDILQVLEGATYAAFILGAIVAVYELRVMSRDRRTDMMMRGMEVFTQRESAEAIYRLLHSTASDAKSLEQEVSGVDLTMVADACEYLSFMAKRKLIDKRAILEFYPFAFMWQRMHLWIVSERALLGPDLYADFEDLAKLQAAGITSQE